MITMGIAIALLVASLVVAIVLLLVIRRKDQQRQRLQEELEEALAAARSANEAKSQFLAGVSHDIRTPCSAVIGLTEIAQRHVDDPASVQECLEKITRSSHHLLNLINDVLDVSKIESGQLTLAEEPFSLHELLADVEVIVQPQAKSKDLTFSVAVDAQVRDWLCGDELHVKQVLLNLIGNAVKYTEPGGFVRLRVSRCDEVLPCEPPVSAATAASGEHSSSVVRLCFEVSDNGIGMAPEFLERIFEPFERELTEETRHIEGTGLGMSIVKNIVDHLGGTISVHSARQQGTTFSVVLPIRTCAVPGHSCQEFVPPARPLRRDFSGACVLLAEDDDISAEIACDIIARTCARVDRVGNGQEAVSRLLERSSNAYDIVFMDVQMPVMDGLSAACALCDARDREGRVVPPLIALTANAYAEDRKRAREAGMVDYLVKPITFEEVCRVLDEHVLCAGEGYLSNGERDGAPKPAAHTDLV